MIDLRELHDLVEVIFYASWSDWEEGGWTRAQENN